MRRLDIRTGLTTQNGGSQQLASRTAARYTASGHVAPTPAIALMKSRRRTASPKAQDYTDYG
jgi:hypothetical protein